MIIELGRMGAYHAMMNGENQDALCHGKNRDLCVITLADGVSECKEAKTGAVIASRSITDLFLKKGHYFLEFEKEQIADFAISHILFELKQYAEEASCSVEEYSSTITSVLVNKRKNKMLCFNVGDSVVLAVCNGKCKTISMPADSSSGCCVTTTKGVEKKAFVSLCDPGPIDSIVICSDGAWHEMFYKNKLRPEVSRMLAENEYNDLYDYLNIRNCYDDCSFISMDLRQRNRRTSS